MKISACRPHGLASDEVGLAFGRGSVAFAMNAPESGKARGTMICDDRFPRSVRTALRPLLVLVTPPSGRTEAVPGLQEQILEQAAGSKSAARKEGGAQ